MATVFYSDFRDAAPRFVRKPKHQEVFSDQAARFECKIVGLSVPLVTWYVFFSDR